MKRLVQRFCLVVFQVCKGILLSLCALMGVAVLLWTPAIFGYQSCIVQTSDTTLFPSGALAYYRYTPIDALLDGDVVALYTDEGVTLSTVTAVDSTARRVSVEGKGEILFPCVEGVAAFCIPHLGGWISVFLRTPAMWISAICLVLLLLAGAFVLPVFSYQPRYGIKKGRHACKSEGDTHES